MPDDRDETLAVFGGSFNPPHISHVLAALYVLAAHPVDRVVVIPTFKHPFSKSLAPFEDRMEMARIAFRHLAPHVEISPIEADMGGVSYTIDTITELRRRHPWARLRLVVGGDILHEVQGWRRFPEIQEQAPLLMIPRAGVAPFPQDPDATEKASNVCPLPEVSSTEIRKALAEGRDPGSTVPWEVLRYIRQHRLYESET